MKVGESSNFELEDLCEKLKIPLIGVFCKDELDYLKRYNGCFIINMMDTKVVSKPDAVGHWVAFYKTKSQSVYFDSFAVYPPNDIIEYITYKTKINKVYYNKDQIQDIADDYCGYICVMFLYWMTYKTKIKKLDERLEDFIKSFDFKNIKKNKQIVNKFFN